MSAVMFTDKPIGAIEHPNYLLKYKDKNNAEKKLYFADERTANNVRLQAQRMGLKTMPLITIAPLVTGEYNEEALKYVEKSKIKREVGKKSRKLKSVNLRLKDSPYTAQTNYSTWRPVKKKKITGFDIGNPYIATTLVALGTYFIAKKAKLI